MEIKNRTTVHITTFEIHYKGFIAKIQINRSEMIWKFSLYNKNNVVADSEDNMHFLSETVIEKRMETTIDDCITNSGEYYDRVDPSPID